MVEGLDPVVVSKLISQQVEQVTCIECCKYFIAPTTAACGHSLCHACWKGRRNCHTCGAPIEKKALKLNKPLQVLTEHLHSLVDEFEKSYNVKLDEFSLEILEDPKEDPTKNVKEWLASSENQFSAPVISSQASDQNIPPQMELSKSKVQVHIPNKKVKSHEKVLYPPHPQEDWDKIEILPDTEEICVKPADQAIGPIDIDPFMLDEYEYSTDNPRRSSRKKESKTDSNPPVTDLSLDKNSGKNCSDTKSLRNKQTWSSVKKMRKEFGKLNKKNKSKLNVSIEMCKKAQSAAKKYIAQQKSDSKLNVIDIDDNTPDIIKNKDSLDQKKSEDHTKRQNSEPDEQKIEEMIIDKFVNDTTKPLHQECDVEAEENTDVIQDTDNVKNKSHLGTYSKDEDVNPSANSKVNTNMPFIKKSSFCHTTVVDENVQITQKEIESNTATINTDDVEISIRIGNTLTNIVIKNKKNDVQVKVNTDQGIQTSLGPYNLTNKNDAGCSPIKDLNIKNIVDTNKTAVNKSISTKKNTDSADTATAAASAQFEITDSMEKELSDVMECLEKKRKRSQSSQKTQQFSKVCENTKIDKIKEPEIMVEANHIPEETDDLNDIDIFNSGSVKEINVKLLKDTKLAPSEILMPTIKSKKSQKNPEKRHRENNDDILPNSKKQKVDVQKNNAEKVDIPPASLESQSKDVGNDSEHMTYDNIMSQVFANIDAEIKNSNTNNRGENTQVFTQRACKADSSAKNSQSQASQIIHKTQNILVRNNVSTVKGPNSSKDIIDQKYSENVFSMLEKDSESHVSGKNVDKVPTQTSTQRHVENLLTPGMCRDLENIRQMNTQIDNDIEMAIIDPEMGTPVVDNDDSDKSVVEETPQKNLSFVKPKPSNEVSKSVNNTNKQKLDSEAETRNELNNKSADSQIIRSIINISNTTIETEKERDGAESVIDLVNRKSTLETPLNIDKFFDHVKHNSTPVAKKSLNFDTENPDDPEQTLCPTTTQEKEFLADAFKQTPTSPVKRPLTLKNVFNRRNKKLYLAGSCLNSAEVKNLKMLCQERGWTFLDKYAKDLTHLVVGVDEENKSQRSVKYMCALAASKWIVSYSWVEKCIQLKTVVDEIPYEALDACGDPGPRRSRTAPKKVFDGITFYCMPPFSILDMDTLKQMILSAGGRVVDDPKGVKVTPENVGPALLLAEPEHTQEDRFVYLAMELSVVPVNYEWVLNCLGSYCLCSIQELLLCPTSVLPPPTKNWPAILLMDKEDDDESS